MILVCQKHVKAALKIIDLPHVQSLSEQDIIEKKDLCKICSEKPIYQLFNYSFQPKRKREPISIGG